MPTLEMRIARLEHDQAAMRRKLATAFALGVCVATAGLAMADSIPSIADEIRTRKLVVVDSQNRPRVEIQEDDEGTERIARAAGIIIFDEQGNERGGFVTLSNGSAGLVLDAPKGVGSPMPDRAMIGVMPDGSSMIGLNSNAGKDAVFLKAGQTEGCIEMSRYELTTDKLETRTFDLATQQTILEK